MQLSCVSQKVILYSILVSETTFHQQLKLVTQSLETGDQTINDIQYSMHKLEQLVFANRNIVFNGDANEIAALMQRTRPQYGMREVKLEKAIGKEILDGNLDPKEAIKRLSKYPPIQRTFNYSALEAKAMKLSEDSRFVHVGCGGLPETLVGIQQMTSGNNLTGIDMDPYAIAKGNAFLKAINLEQINLVQANGAEFDYQNSTDILIAVLVRPEVETVARICETASKDSPVTIALRRSLGVAQTIYDDVSPKSLQLLDQNGFTFLTRVTGHAVVETDIYRRDK